MTSISRSALVPYSASDMFDIVDDVKSYPTFLPWCGSATEYSRSEDVVEACIEIAHSGIHKSFTTRNRRIYGESLEMTLLDGPFRSLHGFWRFKVLSDHGSKITLDLEYEFSSKILSLTIGPAFNLIANTLVDAFCKRADSLYGQEAK